MTALQNLSRDAAERLNPFISDCHIQDTLDHCAAGLRNIGALIANDSSCADGATVYRLLAVLAAALDYERDHVELPAVRRVA